MKKLFFLIIFFAIFLAFEIFPEEKDLPQSESDEISSSPKKNITRIDFEDMLIEGQTKKSETVYLFERLESELESLCWKRKDVDEKITLFLFE